VLAKKTSKNQITLPKPVAEAFPNAEYFDVQVENNRILLRPVRITPVEPVLDGIREKMKKLGVTPKDVDGAIRWARRKKE